MVNTMANISEEASSSTETRIKDLENRLNGAEASNEVLKESVRDATRAMIRMEDIGWSELGIVLSDDMELEELKEVNQKLSEWADTNPLLWRGNEIRCSYLFGGNFEIGTVDAESSISVRARSDIDNPINQAAIFSPEALAANEKARFTSGNMFAMFSKSKRRFTVVPLDQIDDAFYNPEDPSEVWYYKRVYDSRTFNPTTSRFNKTTEKSWVIVEGAQPPERYDIIDRVKVDHDRVMVDSRVNRPVGKVWGMPDSFAAAPWALAYSAYLRDGAKVLSGLAEFIWQLKPKPGQGAGNSGAMIRNSQGAGQTVTTDMEMSALPRANAVDLSTGRPFASQVASALGISVVILLSDPGQSGAYGTAQTLTDPTIRTMLSRRKINTQFLIRCLRLLGIKQPEVRWDKMSPDADYREMQTRLAAYETGLFGIDEVRGPIAELAGFTLLHDDAPDGHLMPNNEASLARRDIDGDSSAMSKATGQGGAKLNSTAKKSYGNNDLRDMDAAAQ